MFRKRRASLSSAVSEDSDLQAPLPIDTSRFASVYDYILAALSVLLGLLLIAHGLGFSSSSLLSPSTAVDTAYEQFCLLNTTKSLVERLDLDFDAFESTWRDQGHSQSWRDVIYQLALDDNSATLSESQSWIDQNPTWTYLVRFRTTATCRIHLTAIE